MDGEGTGRITRKKGDFRLSPVSNRFLVGFTQMEVDFTDV